MSATVESNWKLPCGLTRNVSLSPGDTWTPCRAGPNVDEPAGFVLPNEPESSVEPFLSTNHAIPSPPPVSASLKPPVTFTVPAIGLVQVMNVSRVDAGSTSVCSPEGLEKTQSSGVPSSSVAECQQAWTS